MRLDATCEFAINEQNVIEGYFLRKNSNMSSRTLSDGGFNVTIEKDSLSPMSGRRLTTFVVRYPRCIHSELMTHRAFSRNAESSRAMPFAKQMAVVSEEPFIPIHWGIEEGGMQCPKGLPDELAALAEKLWLEGRDFAATQARLLQDIGNTYATLMGDDRFTGVKLHKTMPNRMIEPYAWITVIITATEWENFFRLRDHGDAEVHFQKLAWMMRAVMRDSTPVSRRFHRPFVADGLNLGCRDYNPAGLDYKTAMSGVFLTNDLVLQDNFRVLLTRVRRNWGEIDEFVQADWSTLPFDFTVDGDVPQSEFESDCDEVVNRVSCARCSRVSYLKQGKEPTVLDDLSQFDRLVRGSGFGHWSPHEHIGISDLVDGTERSGNFIGWSQWRKKFPGENVAS